MNDVKVRSNASRKIEVGSVFREADGPYVMTHRESYANADGHAVYRYTLKKLSPDEAVVWEVLGS